MTNIIDEFAEKHARDVAKYSSRRGVLSLVGRLLVGAVVAGPILPIARGAAAAEPKAPSPAAKGASDPLSCDYWKYCGLGGNLCGCCGGSSSQCATGTVPSKVHWVGTCKSAADGKDYMIAYRDCCGQSPCGRCFCETSIGSQPGYTMGLSQDMNWCMDNASLAVYCTTATVVGVA